MCGITAVINENCSNIIIDSLIQLQNRGYDSAGIGTIVNDNFVINKYASDNNNTGIDKIQAEIINHNGSNIGIGHTRWATHGGKTDNNSHPHISYDNKILVVHNGIIENFFNLKNILIKKKIKFKSDTDTEVISNLLAYEYNKTNNMLISIENTIKVLEGTWGLCIMCIDHKDVIYCTRKGSPLLVGINNDLGMIVSEQTAFCNKVNNYIVLKENDICSIKFNNNLIEMDTKYINYDKKQINELNIITNPHPFTHWTLREIYEQKESSLRALSLGGRILSDDSVRLGGLIPFTEIIIKLDNIILLGCGTSYYAGLYSIDFFRDLCDFNTVNVCDGAEFNENIIPKIGNTGLILLSQSGETKDLHRCIDIGKKNNLFLIGVINVVDSMISREVHCGCYLNAGREVGVASTKSFTSQAIVLSMIAIWISEKKQININKRKMYIKDLRNLSNDIGNAINLSYKNIDKYLDLFKNHKSCFLLGKNKGEAIAKEGALKIKEISYIHAEGYSSSGLKHGPFALLTDKFPVIIIAPYNFYYSKNLNAYNEIKSRNANILFITDTKTEKKNVIYIPKNNTYSELLCVIPLQMLAYKISISKDINPDMPKNLAKVVTVE